MKLQYKSGGTLHDIEIDEEDIRIGLIICNRLDSGELTIRTQESNPIISRIKGLRISMECGLKEAAAIEYYYRQLLEGRKQREKEWEDFMKQYDEEGLNDE